MYLGLWHDILILWRTVKQSANIEVISVHILSHIYAGFPGCVSGKEPTSANTGDIRDMGSIPGLWRSPGGGYGNPFPYSCLENPMDRGARWAKVHRLQGRRVRHDWRDHAHIHTHIHLFAPLTICLKNFYRNSKLFFSHLGRLIDTSIHGCSNHIPFSDPFLTQINTHSVIKKPILTLVQAISKVYMLTYLKRG